ncbi:MAG: hypothetical protein K6B17_08290 [Treponema sp.]|nr:hypothetical protein [Treponema sp.]
MRLFSKLTMMLCVLLSACFITSCSDEAPNGSGSSYNMHYFFTDYGTNSAMIRTADNSDVAILSTTEAEKGGDLYDGTFVTLTKTKNGNSYTFSGTRSGTEYTVTGSLTNTSNGTTNDSFTIQSSSDSIQSLGFTSGTSIQHWTEKNQVPLFTNLNFEFI